MSIDKQTLRRFLVFDSVDEKTLTHLAQSANQVRYAAHANIFNDGETGDKFYLLKSGSVDIFKPSPDGDVILNTMQPGDHFGEMSLIDNKPRSAAARARSDAVVIEIFKNDFLAVTKEFPVLLYQAARASSQRLRERDDVLMQELREHNRQLQQLYDTSLDISRHLELDQALHAMVHRATDLLASTGGTLHLYQAATGKLVAQAPFKNARTEQVARRAFSTGKPVVENRLRVLAAPICLGSETIGVLSVYREKKSAPFTQDDANLLLLFANQSAIAIENARLYGLATEKGRMDGELDAARKVQRNLLPTRAPRIPGFRLAGMWQPARQVAGDYYDYIALGNGKFGIVIADVSDKGMPAALFMAATRSVVRASTLDEHAPERALQRANRLLCTDAANGMFVTLFLGILDSHSNRFTYANAGHNPPFLWRAETKRLERLSAHGLALGILPFSAYAANQIEMCPGDLLVLYTDGITDVVDQRGHAFGERRLKKLIYDHTHAPASELTNAVEKTVREFVGDQPLFDDVTMVVLSHS
ncbi:MAG: SpoIIE family protein phosphatase [Chloroflexi bacterium]|nr:SpoIIE family protein phosphatase [Chloroflexota bacterium]